MATVAEALAAAAEQQKRAVRKEQKVDRFARFYRSRSWQAAAYRWKKKQPRPLRRACCGATAQDAKLVVDHIVPLKNGGWSRRFDEGNYQLLCNDDNLAKASSDQTDWRAGATTATEKQHA
jgi:5-methylcytosine-specific restriction endonuclease McrA